MTGSKGTQTLAIVPEDVSAQSSQAAGSRAPILCLSTELVHMVFENLKPSEAATLRFLDREFAAVGAEYLVPGLLVISTRESFERLKAIANHPVVRYNVFEVYYSGTYLPQYDRVFWERHVQSPESLRREAFSERYPFVKDLSIDAEVTAQGMSKAYGEGRHQYDADQLNNAYLLYQRILEEQKQIATSEEYAERIIDAMTSLPRLKKVMINIGQPYAEDDYVIETELKAYAATFCRPLSLFSGDRLGMPSGILQSRSILQGLHCAGIELETLHLDGVGWRLFELAGGDLENMKSTLSSLLDLDLLLGGGMYPDGPGDEVLEGRSFVAEGRLAELVTSAPKLRYLGIDFDEVWDETPIELRHITNNFHWSFLKSVKFGLMNTSEDFLISFITRHRKSLTELCLYSISLTDASWASTFQRMRQVCELKQARFGGLFYNAVDESDTWDFERPQGHSEKEKIVSLRTCVEDYVMGMGPDQQIDDLLAKRGIDRTVSAEQ